MPHSAGIHTIYTRPNVADDWVAQPTLRLTSPVVERRCAAVTRVQIEQTNITTTETVTPENYAHNWLRISYTPNGGTETDIFYGFLQDMTIHEDTGLRTWPGLSIEALLQRVKCVDALAHRVNPDDAELITLPVFNEDFDRGLGLMDDADYYHTARDATFKTAATSPDPGVWDHDATLAFAEPGTVATWHARAVLDALARWHCPPSGSDFCPISFLPVFTADAADQLELIQERWDFFGRSLFDVLNELCRAAGDLTWTCDWAAEDGTNWGYDQVRIYIFDRDHDNLDADYQAEHVLTRKTGSTTDTLASKVSVSVKDRVAGVRVYGEPIRVQFTVDYTTTTFPMYRKGWSATDETNYANDSYPLAKLTNAYRRLYLPVDQASGGATTWNVFAQSAPGYFITSIGDAWDVSPVPPFAGDALLRTRAILPQNLTRTGRSYTSQSPTTALSYSDTNMTGEMEHDPILAWLNPTSRTVDAVKRIEGVQPLRHECGVRLPPGWRNDANLATADLTQTTGGTPAWQQLVLTVSIETDLRCVYEATASPKLPYDLGKDDEHARYAVKYVPGAHWWGALNATVDIASNGTQTKVDGVLRNDLPRLKDAADQVLARMNTRTVHANVHMVAVDPSKKLGDFITTYNAYNLNNCIVQARYHLDAKPLGTELITGLPRR
jgi:hypothetical protein